MQPKADKAENAINADICKKVDNLINKTVILMNNVYNSTQISNDSRNKDEDSGSVYLFKND